MVYSTRDLFEAYYPGGSQALQDTLSKVGQKIYELKLDAGDAIGATAKTYRDLIKKRNAGQLTPDEVKEKLGDLQWKWGRKLLGITRPPQGEIDLKKTAQLETYLPSTLLFKGFEDPTAVYQHLTQTAEQIGAMGARGVIVTPTTYSLAEALKHNTMPPEAKAYFFNRYGNLETFAEKSLADVLHLVRDAFRPTLEDFV